MARGGARPGAGRPKGSVNGETKQLREMILGALDMAGGESYLAEQAEKNPSAFLSLIGRVLPTTLASDPHSPLPGIVIGFERPNESDRQVP